MGYKVDKIYTESPYVDEIVYYTKLLAVNTIIKNEQEALNNETLESLKNASMFIQCKEDTISFELIDSFPAEVLESSGIPAGDIEACIANKDEIPESKRDLAVEKMKAYIIENYEELNEYYRRITGIAPLNYPKFYADWSGIPISVNIDTNKAVQDMIYSEILLLDKYNLLDDIIAEDPQNRDFLHYVGKNITPYFARKAVKFSILYTININNNTIRDMYIDKFEVERLYTLRTVYSEAYKYESDYYDSFISAFIVLMTMIDLISRVQEFIAKKEIFDIRTVQYILESYGVPYFKDIPLKYQERLVKNLHTILKHKSTSQCMVDICSLFGFNNINIFKYYLLKDRIMDPKTNDFKFAYKTIQNPDGSTSVVEDTANEYELRFFKVPIQGEVDNYIRDMANHVNYDEVTTSDTSWDGDLEHDHVKEKILEMEFNYARSKYISIDTVYDIAKLSTQQSYFFNILYDNVKLEDEIVVKVPFLSAAHSFRVADLFTFLNILTYIFYNIKDEIIDTQGKLLHINGFNFNADFEALSAYLYKITNLPYHLTKNSFRVEVNEIYNKFRKETTSLLSMEELMNLFANNLDVRSLLIEGMYEADNKKIYSVFKKLYDSLMEVELTLDYYKNPETNDFYRDAKDDATLTEFLKNRDEILYYTIIDIETGFDDTAARNQYICSVIDNIVYALEEYIDTDKYKGLFSNLPLVSSEAIKVYVSQVINFFKSFKITFLGLNSIYILDDKYDGVMKFIDDVKLKCWWVKPDFMEGLDKIDTVAHTVPMDDSGMIDYAYVCSWILKDMQMEESTDNILEVIKHMMIILTRDENTTFAEVIGTHSNTTTTDLINLVEGRLLSTNFTCSDAVSTEELIMIDVV